MAQPSLQSLWPVPSTEHLKALEDEAIAIIRQTAAEFGRPVPLFGGDEGWTELDVWQYIQAEALELPSLYLAKRRRVFERDGMLYCETPCMRPRPDECVFEASVRYRSVGDATCTAAARSSATEWRPSCNGDMSAEVLGELRALEGNLDAPCLGIIEHAAEKPPAECAQSLDAERVRALAG